MWSYEWIDGYNDDVFGYLLPPWYSFSLFGISYIDNTTIPTGVCAFPDSYFWGETYISATKNCKDLEIARLFLETLCCDADTMYEIGINNEWDLMNNRSAVQKMIDNQDKPWSDGALETDDVLVVYDSIAGNIMNTGSLNNVSSVDEDDAEETDTSDSAGSSDEDVTKDTDTYSVVEGDCLWKIAEEYYGDGAEYVKIYEANRSVIDAHGGGADLIYVGDVLILP
ncbi:MAG: LysM peptidoglycan-binding domain-containing protein [Lachnospiraceae bacterium]|nr:LysM peptidoglycan-binding domain-containing protein [Lachnospiraceae bacterium]